MMTEYQNTKIYHEDVAASLQSVPDGKKLQKMRILVTGASGMIGSFLTDVLLLSDADVTVAGRRPEELSKRFSCKALWYDLAEEIRFEESFAAVFHCAGYGHPAAFLDDPAGVLRNSILGTERMLRYAAAHDVKQFLYVSSGEVYGGIDSMNVRACYPLGKQAGENLCAAYGQKYGLHTVSARLCHTFGPGFSAQDNRAVTQFFRRAALGEAIILKSKGEQLRSYLYAADSVSALLTVFLHGNAGCAYDIASGDCRTTIAELAAQIAKEADTTVRYEIPDEKEQAEQSPIASQVLDEARLRALGWNAAFTLPEGVKRMVGMLKE